MPSNDASAPPAYPRSTLVPALPSTHDNLDQPSECPMIHMLAVGYIYATLLYKFYAKTKIRVNRRVQKWPTKRRTHCTNRIKQGLLRQRLRQASLITLPPSSMTPTHRRPRPIDAGATTAKQQVIVQPVLLSRRTATPKQRRRGTLDGDHDGRIIRGCKDVATKPIRVGFPTKRVPLPHVCQSTHPRIRKLINRTKKRKKKKGHTLSHSSLNSYHAASSGVT